MMPFIQRNTYNMGEYNLLVTYTPRTDEEQQYNSRGLPISHYLAKLKARTGKPAYCLFLAPTINEACIAHFYALHHMNISYYGGTSEILPLPVSIFRKMVEDSYKASYTPNPQQVRKFFEWSANCAKNSQSEKEWYEKVQDKAREWLNIA